MSTTGEVKRRVQIGIADEAFAQARMTSWMVRARTMNARVALIEAKTQSTKVRSTVD